MPAIDLIRLRTSLKILLNQLGNPLEFVRGLHDIFAYYGNLTHPLGNSPSGIKSMPAFNTPALLNKELLLSLSGYCQDQPTLMLEIIDLLWREPEIEKRQLAAQLLGKLPVDYSSAVIDNIKHWSENLQDAELLPFLHQQGSFTLRKTNPEAWLEILDGWKESREPKLVQLAINGVIPLIDDLDFQNLPAIFTFLTPLLLSLEKEYHFELLNVIDHLAHRSEVETVYFLKNMVPLISSVDAGRFLRRSLESFSPEMQESLRKELRTRDN